MDIDNLHAPLDPTASGSSQASITGSAEPPSRRYVYSNADFYTSHFESHVTSVAAHFRGETTEQPTAANTHLFVRPPTGPSKPFAWSEADKNLFFASLRRRGKSWPELIVADMAGRKTLVEVTAYLAQLDTALNALPPERREQLRVPPPRAREVSERWVEFEQDMASDHLDRSRKRERREELDALQAKRNRALTQAKRSIPPPPWKQPGAGPRTSKQKRRREAQFKAVRQELEKEFAREDWLRLLDKDKAQALSREIKQPSRLNTDEPSVSNDDSESDHALSSAAQPVQTVKPPVALQTPPAVISFQSEALDLAASSVGAAQKRPRIPFRAGRINREIVVMRLGDLLRNKGLDVLNLRVAHSTLSYNPTPESEPLQVPLTILEDAVAVLRTHVKHVLSRTLVLQQPDHDSELDQSSASDTKSASTSRLITGKNVRQALESLQGPEEDHWFNDVGSAPLVSAQVSPKLTTSSLRGISSIEPNSAGSDDSDVDNPAPIVSIKVPPARVRFKESLMKKGVSLRTLGEPSIYRSQTRIAKEQPLPAGLALVPADSELPQLATFYSPGGLSALDVSDDEIEADRVKTEDDEADALQDQADLAADHAWEASLWATISAMDPDGLAWLTLGNLIDVENSDLTVQVLSDDEEVDGELRSDDDVSDGGMRKDADPLSRISLSVSPAPRTKSELASQL